ncbi:MAG: flavodoxin family protein [Synergistaceae bacterium]|nr:flavodoxin family protein [Synergistaceae bacterium]
MKVVAINGSPHADGNTAAALGIMAEELAAEGIETEILQVGGQMIRGCVDCGHCSSSEANACVFKDDVVNEFTAKMRSADGIILGAPTYFAGIPGETKAFLDRAFYSSRRSERFKHKVGTALTVARRAGGNDALHQLMDFLDLSETVTPPAQYWTVVYGREKKEVLKDEEGIQTLRKNARAMAWLIKMIDATKGKIPTPGEGRTEKKLRTNFIR